MPNDPFTDEYTVPDHDGVTVNAVYTNDIASVDAWIKRIEATLAGSKENIVGVDVEYTPRLYTRSRGCVQKAAVIQLCVGHECLIYHICCAADCISDKFDGFLRNWHYRYFICLMVVLPNIHARTSVSLTCVLHILFKTVFLQFKNVLNIAFETVITDRKSVV